MSRDLNHLASLNTVDGENSSHEEQKQHEEELQMFSNTTFFDLDMGRSTDIATTVDELLMQQEKQIQYPHKQQPLEDTGPIAGPSYTSCIPAQKQQQSQQPQQLQQPQQSQQSQQQASYQLEGDRQPLIQRNLPFDFSTLQGFSLAGELPQASLSIYDVDPLFHDQTSSGTQQQSQSQIQTMREDLYPHHHVARPPIVQRHEVAEHYGPPVPQKGVAGSPESDLSEQPTYSRQSSVTDSKLAGGLDDEKRKRNTAASARFRIKKKMREQEMEKMQKEMQQRLADQQERIKQLEMENRWLKNLVVEKNNARDSSSIGKLRQELLMQEGNRGAQKT